MLGDRKSATCIFTIRLGLSQATKEALEEHALEARRTRACKSVECDVVEECLREGVDLARTAVHVLGRVRHVVEQLLASERSVSRTLTPQTPVHEELGDVRHVLRLCDSWGPLRDGRVTV